MKKSLFFLSIIIGLFSCNHATDKKIDTVSAQQEKNIELTKQYYTLFNNHEWNGMAEMYTETADFKDPSLGQGIVKQTQAETVAKYSALNEIFPDLHDEIIQIYPSGANHVIVEFVSTGTAPDNSKFELPICTILTFKNGKIIKDFTYYDNFDEEEAND